MKSGMSAPAVVFLVLILATSAAIGVVSLVGTPAHETANVFVEPGSFVVGSTSGLNLSLSLSSTLINPGQVVSVNIDEQNTLSTENTVPSSRNWPVPGLSLGPCGSLNLPIGIEIISGFYLSSNITGAQPLQLSEPGTYFCPAILLIDSYTFEPHSDMVIGTFTGRVNSTVDASGYWARGGPSSPASFQLVEFAPGTYTVVGGDEWGSLAILHFTVVAETSSPSDILPAGTTFSVSSSFDCVAGHYSVNFSVPEESTLAGGFSAGTPGVTLYVATALQAGSTFQGHPSEWVYSTGLVNSTRFTVVLPPGSYVVWFEGADMNCGSQIVTPLEMLTPVSITEGFSLSSSVATVSTTATETCTPAMTITQNSSSTTQTEVITLCHEMSSR